MPNNSDIPLIKKKNPFQDSMKMGDGMLRVSVRCARCNEPVQAGTPHTCKTKGGNKWQQQCR